MLNGSTRQAAKDPPKMPSFRAICYPTEVKALDHDPYVKRKNRRAFQN